MHRSLLLTFLLAASVVANDLPVGDAAAFAEAVKTVAAGDTILLQDGTWADARLKIHASGTAENPVAFKAQTPGMVALKGDSHRR